MPEPNYSDKVQVAREYYNSSNADRFYAQIWGGEDIHIGLYFSDSESIPAASRRTVQHMASLLSPPLLPTHRVLDLGAGYGGSARYLAKTYQCPVTCLNLSEVQNQRNRSLTHSQQLDHLIQVVDGNFESIPDPDESFDLVWSQDAILHSGHREKVLDEVHRVLKPGGRFLFTDPMQSDDCPPNALEPILQRIHLSSLGSYAFYRQQAHRLGWKEVLLEDHSHQLTRHYGRVRSEIQARAQNEPGLVTPEFLEKMTQGLTHWVQAGEKGLLRWGISLYQKP